ncbi:helix-turn-helix transcriptional regulator [Limosilactobacillus reuteri]|uniref:helix-turn-helix domain-containing protein n=1 Tax=Limosilactobacillus reuteri TaxID=1598 RepID=UPI001E41591F|nr:helix-turn-helix transcriptional regulator [Limosilactobacillus reuteri]MCC4343603.1 helix-turn-helix domain-containing protein [Limosilactobacillus reuteri]MCC4355854.1 helix-turn-helix domain-containing protein [Limosilactobacillus reuteri]WJK30744.1 helix-turn-helix transcriptional regulator [Limosilactobacillus reuteri]
MKLSNKQVTAIKRKRGELGLSITDLARQVGLSRRTIYNIFTEDDRTVNPTTYRKLSDWLIDEYATAEIKDSTAVATQDK